MGLVPLIGLRTFRPAWKRALQGLSDLITQSLQAAPHFSKAHLPCIGCGEPAPIQIVDALEPDASSTSPSDPYRFSVRWHCARCGDYISAHGDLPPVDQIIYWSDPRIRQFMTQHPRWLTTSSTTLEHAGQPAIRLSLTDLTSSASLTILAHRHTLSVLTVQNS